MRWRASGAGRRTGTPGVIQARPCRSTIVGAEYSTDETSVVFRRLVAPQYAKRVM
jgi:hypothetical protein